MLMKFWINFEAQLWKLFLRILCKLQVKIGKTFETFFYNLKRKLLKFGIPNISRKFEEY